MEQKTIKYLKSLSRRSYLDVDIKKRHNFGIDWYVIHIIKTDKIDHNKPEIIAATKVIELLIVNGRIYNAKNRLTLGQLKRTLADSLGIKNYKKRINEKAK